MCSEYYQNQRFQNLSFVQRRCQKYNVVRHHTKIRTFPEFFGVYVAVHKGTYTQHYRSDGDEQYEEYRIGPSCG